MEVTYEHKCGRWAGPVELIVETAKMAQEEMNTWTEKELSCRVTVSWANRTEKLDEIDSLSNIKEYDLSTIKGIYIDIGHYLGAPSLSLKLDSTTSMLGALRITLVANDKTRAEGLFKRVTEHLGRFAGRIGWYQRWIGAEFILFILITTQLLILKTGLLVQRFGLTAQDGHTESAEIIELTIRGFLIPAALTYIVWWLTPTLQLLGPVSSDTKIPEVK